jgi:hypothetical protein
MNEVRSAASGARNEQSEHRIAELEAALAEIAGAARDADARAGDSHVRAERLTHEIKKLEEELQRQRDRGFRLTRDVEDEKKARQKAELELGMIRSLPKTAGPELATTRERVSYLEEALRASEEVTSVLQARIIEAESAASLRGEQAALLAAEVDAMRIAAELGQGARAQVDELTHRAEQAERRAQALEAHASEDAHAADLHGLEATLRERARVIQSLEHELARRDKMVKELLFALEESSANAAGAPSAAADASASAEEREAVERLERENSELRSKLEKLALEAARREGDVQTTAWRITELEQALDAQKSAPKEEAASAPAAVEIQAALEQVDVLKQALAQEHESRRKAESGEELSRARAELQRQATLIEQLSRELDARDVKDTRGASV